VFLKIKNITRQELIHKDNGVPCRLHFITHEQKLVAITQHEQFWNGITLED